jgi:type I restriction enzyme, S subunit
MGLLEQHFDVAFAAPDGIKKLRELILTLAMQGKLVNQDPNEGSGQELIPEIKDWKIKMVREKVFIKSSKLELNRDNSKLPELPKSWCWTHIGIICGSIVPSRDKPKSFSGGYPWVTVSNFDSKGIKLLLNHSGIGLSDREVQEYGVRIMPRNTVLMSCVGRFGFVAVIDKEVVTNQQIHGFVIPEQLSSEYVAYVIKSQKDFLDSSATSTTISYLNKSRCESIPFPLPPLAEQRRIVAKIDQLMARCDELEKLRIDRSQRLLTVHTAALDRLLTAKDSSEFSTAWSFITQHFGELYSVKENVVELRKTILQLAVMGKLVRQDPNDEPASELLRSIELEKQRLVKEKKIRCQKPLPDIKPEEIPYVIPNSWEWCYLDDLCTLITDGTHYTPTYTEAGIPFISVKNLSSGKLNFSNTRFISEQEHNEFIKRCHPEEGDVLLTKVGTTGIAVTISTNKEFSIFVSVALLKFVKEFIDADYLTRLINSPLVKKYSADGTEGVGNKNLVLRKIKAFIIPIPPLAEQRRIVEKIDRLMGMCDRLEDSIESGKGKQTDLLNALMSQV